MLEKGDVMLSLRNINLIFIFDPDTLQIRWHQTGPWLRQHDPNFISTGDIYVYNNRKDDQQGRRFVGSNIIRLDPVSRNWEIIYKGTEDHPFYTNVLGKHQYLGNGNLLIAGGHEGRVFEVTPSREIVWEYINRFDGTRVIMTHQGTRYPPDYFQVTDWSCT